MSNKLLMLSIMTTMLGSTAYAADNVRCDKLTDSLRESERIVDSLRVDKPGQMRVFAADGSEFTAGQVLWMKCQLREIAKACEVGSAEDASRRLSEVEQLLKQHQRSFPIA